MVRLLGSINRKIVGRANYYRHVVSMKVFDRVDSAIYKRLHRMIKRKHPQKSATWLYQNSTLIVLYGNGCLLHPTRLIVAKIALYG